ncbi:MAG: hypothetical protein ABGW69_00725 [Nanoarchaeota archaeon]
MENLDDFYELTPVHPLKKLKKEIEELKKQMTKAETTIQYGEIMKEVMEAIKINQRITEEMIKSNAALQTKISEMIIMMNRLIEEIQTMGEAFKKAAEALVVETKTERTEELLNKLLEQMTKMLKQNENIIDSLTRLEKQFLQKQLLRATPPQIQSNPISLNSPSPSNNQLPLPNQNQGMNLKLPKL